MSKLTVKAIKALRYPEDGNGRRVVLWDSEIPGFGARVQPSGRKVYVLSYRFRGRKRLMTIERINVLPLFEARERARRALVAVSDGHDPLQRRALERTAPTMGSLFKQYHESGKKAGKRSLAEDERRITHHLDPWRNHQIAAITQRDVETLHVRIGATAPYEANRVLSLLSRLFSLAAEWGMTPAEWRSPVRGVERFPEVKRDRWLTQVEVSRLAVAIDAEPNQYIRGVLWLYLLTGARRMELLRAQWQNLETDAAGNLVLVLRKTKSGRSHRIPLSAPAKAILNELPHVDGNPYIFPGKRRGHPLVNIAKSWNRVRDRADLPGVRLHDLRRTVGSWLAQSGKTLQLVGKVLNHSDPSTTEIYARLADSNLRDALEALGQQIMGAAGKRDSAAVIELKRADLCEFK